MGFKFAAQDSTRIDACLIMQCGNQTLRGQQYRCCSLILVDVPQTIWWSSYFYSMFRVFEGSELKNLLLMRRLLTYSKINPLEFLNLRWYALSQVI